MSDFNWDDDFLDGDIDFDIDFDGKKEGFFKSVLTGFLSGVKADTIGSTDSQIAIVKRALPRSFSTAWDFTNALKYKKAEFLQNLKENSAEMMGDLTYLSGRLSASLRDKVPNKISDSLESFSQKDFSDWEKSDFQWDDSVKLEHTSEEDVQRVIADLLQANSLLQVESTDVMSTVMNNIGSRTLAMGQESNKSQQESNFYLSGLLKYHEVHMSRHEELKINLLTRLHLTSIKFYKFMEASQHRAINELKKVVANTGMSDYEKTSHFNATKRHLRDNLLSTVTTRAGGFGDVLNSMFGNEANKEVLEVLSSIVGDARMASEMTEGMDINVGNFIGDFIGREVVRKGPEFFETEMGKRWLSKLRLKFPEQANKIDEIWKQLTHVGDEISYITKALPSVLGSHYRETGEMETEHETYEDYLDSLEPDQTPIPKMTWGVLNLGTKAAQTAFNRVGENYYEEQGTLYTIKDKSIMSLRDNAQWTVHDSRSLTESIPDLLSEIHLSVEKIRTREDNQTKLRYDFKNSRMSTADRINQQVKRMVTPTWELESYANNANTMVDTLDDKNTLTEDTRQALAFKLARDADKGIVFNPYDYLGMSESNDMSKAAAEELDRFIRERFQLTEELIEKTTQNNYEGLLARLRVPTEEGSKLLHELSLKSESLKNYLPNIAKQIDVARSLGMDDGLKEAGLISVDEKNNREVINQEYLWDELRKHIKKEDTTIAPVSSVPEFRPSLIRSNQERITQKVSETPDLSPLTERIALLEHELRSTKEKQGKEGPGFPEVVEAIKELTKEFNSLDFSERQQQELKLELGELPQNVLSMRNSLTSLVENSNQQLLVLRKIKTISGLDEEDSDEPLTDYQRKQKEDKKSLIERLRGVVPKDLFNKGIETLLNNQPLVLGGMLGGLAATAISSPKTAALLTLGAGAAKLYTTVYGVTRGAEPKEDENIYDEEGNEILYAHKKDVGDYYDQISGKVIKSWKDIKGGVAEMKEGVMTVVAPAKRLGGRIFGADGRAVFLEGLDKLKKYTTKAFKALDPFGKVNAIIEGAKKRLDQMDVFKAGESTPVLRRIGFENNWYYNKDGEPVKGWKEVEGPVYDEEGNELVSLDDLHNGLRTIAGVKIDTAQRLSKSLGLTLGKGASWLKNNGRQELGKRIGGFNHGNITGSGDFNSITSRLDLIYELLKLEFGKDVEQTVKDSILKVDKVNEAEVKKERKDAENLTGVKTDTGEKVRLNSLADKIRKKKEEREARYQEAMVDLAENLTGEEGESKGKDKESDGGLLGKLLGKSFPMIMKGFGLFFGGIPKLFGILTGISSGIVGIGKMLAGLLLGKKTSGVVDGMIPGDKGKRPKGRKPRFSKKMKFGLGAALTMGGGYAIDAAKEYGDVEDGSTTDNVLGATETLLDVAGLGLTASAVAGMFGTSLTGIATAAAPFLLNPITLGAIAVGTAAYFGYKYFTSNRSTPQIKARMAQYGIDEQHEDLINVVMEIETKLSNYVVIRGDSASLSQDTPLEEILNPLLQLMTNPQSRQNTIYWFNGRFKPVFLIYHSAIKSAGIRSLEELDKLENIKAYQVVKQTHNVAGSFNPPPYRVDVVITDEVIALNYASTLNRVSRWLKEMMDKYDTTKLASNRLDNDLAIRSEEVRAKEQSEAGFFKRNWMKLTGEYVSDEEKRLTDAKFKPDEVLASIDISDMLPGDKPVSLITAFRLAAYGNDQNVPWRVEAILKLERWMEANTSYQSGKVTFTGTSEEFYNTFKVLLRIENPSNANVVVDWFNHRFLPIYLAWHKLCMSNRGGLPSKVWRSLSKTNLAKFGREVMELNVMFRKRSMSVLEILVSPFEGVRSGGKTTRLKRLLEALEFDANEAKLMDPELERNRTVDRELVTETPQLANLMTKTTKQQVDEKRDQLNKIDFTKASSFKATQWETKPDPNNPVPQLPPSTEKLNPVKVNLDEKIDVSPELKPGEDKGVSVNKDQMVKLIVKEMVKAGYTDPKEIAQMLALTDYETGGFRHTTENMNYRDPARARSIFRKLKPYSISEVRDIISQGPVTLANKVYNGWLGNTRTPNDGWMYRGRGLVHLTGLDNYAKASKDLGIDLINNPKLVSEDPEVMTKTALWFLENNSQLQSIKEHGDFRFSARGLNGGKDLPGMSKRESLYNEYLAKLTKGDLGESNEELVPVEGDSNQVLPIPSLDKEEDNFKELVKNPIVETPKPKSDNFTPTYTPPESDLDVITPSKKDEGVKTVEPPKPTSGEEFKTEVARRQEARAKAMAEKSAEPLPPTKVEVDLKELPDVKLSKETEAIFAVQMELIGNLTKSIEKQTEALSRDKRTGMRLS